MTNTSLARAAILLLAADNDRSPWYEKEAEIGSLIPLAFNEFAERVMQEPQRISLLSQNYSVSLTAGIGDPMTATGSNTGLMDILWRSIPWGVVTDADGGRLHYIPDYFTFQGPQIAGFNYYTLISERIYVRKSDTPYTLGNILAPLTVTAVFVPTVSTLPVQFENDMVQTLANMAVNKIVGVPPATI